MKAKTCALVLVAFMVVGTAVLLGCGKENDHGGHDHTAAPVGTALAEAGNQETCPMMGTPINKSLYVDHDGKRVYVCCEQCLAPVKENPAKYITELEEKGVTLAKVRDRE